MNIETKLTEKITEIVEKLPDTIKSPLAKNSFVDRYVDRVFSYDDPKKYIAGIEIHDNTPIRLIKLDLLAAAGVVASLIGGVVGISNPIILGSVIVSSVISLNSLFDEASKAECALFWIIYESDDHCGERKEIKDEFKKVCKSIDEISKKDFNSALNSLIDLNMIKQDGDTIIMAEKIVFTWFSD